MRQDVTLRIDGREVTVAAGTTVAAAIAIAAGQEDARETANANDTPRANDTIRANETSRAQSARNGVREPGTPSFRRSGRFEEPRAPICGMGICHECRVTVDGVPQVRSCLTVVRPGMVVTSDRPVSDAVAHVHAATAGRPPQSPTTEAALPGEADVVIVGAGPAGLAAARVAGAAGRDVLLLDENVAPGGQIWRGGSDPRAVPENAQFVFSTAVVDHRPGDRTKPGTLVLLRDGRFHEMHYRDLVLATGARELFLPFPGWTLPGVFGAGGLQALVNGGWPIEGRRVVVAGTGPLLLAVAAFLRERGAEVVLIAEQTPARALLEFGRGLLGRREKWAQMWELRTALAGVPYRTGQWIAQAEGRDGVERVVLTNGASRWSEPCDAVAVGYGLVPSNELARLIGCETDDRGNVRVDEFQRTDRPRVYAIGELTGIGGVELSEVEGEIVGSVLRAREGDHHPTLEPELVERRERARSFAVALERAFALRPELAHLADDETIVCRCEDVKWRELSSHRAFRDAKLVTRCGMGACQGRVCGAALRELRGWAPDTPRPPISPVPVGAWMD
ncbi:MAG: FAD-dependent oxidoreductase [Candidatus Eisenbacteria bacterium]